MSEAVVAAGFSLINRSLLYLNILLAPAQYYIGLSSYWPTSIGFLVYHFYTQLTWYQAIQRHELHALSLVPIHFSLIYAISYLASIGSTTPLISFPTGIATAGLLLLNTVATWTNWRTCMTEGLDIYEFFFFGWHRLTLSWHRFFAAWQAFNTILTLCAVIIAIVGSFLMYRMQHHGGYQFRGFLGIIVGFTSYGLKKKSPWWYTLAIIPVGAVFMLLWTFPLIIWTEMIVRRNKILSPTDWISVWLSIAQIVLLLLPVLWTSLFELVNALNGRVPRSTFFEGSLLWQISQAEVKLSKDEAEADLLREYDKLMSIVGSRIVNHPYWRSGNTATFRQRFEVLEQYDNYIRHSQLVHSKLSSATHIAVQNPVQHLRWQPGSAQGLELQRLKTEGHVGASHVQAGLNTYQHHGVHSSAQCGPSQPHTAAGRHGPRDNLQRQSTPTFAQHLRTNGFVAPSGSIFRARSLSAAMESSHAESSEPNSIENSVSRASSVTATMLISTEDKNCDSEHGEDVSSKAEAESEAA